MSEMNLSMAEAIKKLRSIGWVEGVERAGQECGIGFTKDGIDGLKPLAELWQRVGGLKDREAFAVFFIAALSQKPSPSAN